MFDKLKKVGKDTVIYGLGSAISKLLGFILIPVYISHIPIADFGNLSIFEISVQFLSVIFTFGISNAHQRMFYSEKSSGSYGVFLFNNYFGNLALMLFFMAPLVVFPNLFSNLLFDNTQQSFNLVLALWVIPADVLFYFVLQIFQFERKPILFLFYSVVKLLVSLLLTVYMVVYQNMGIEGILMARLVASVVVTLFLTFFVVVPRCTIKVNLPYLSRAIRFGLPMIISSVGSMVFLLSDRYMLSFLSTMDEVGKYSFGQKIANFINLIFIQTIGLSYLPSAIENENDKNTRYYRKMLTYYVFVIGFIILGFLLFYKDILQFIGKNNAYWEGLNIVPLLCLSFLIMGMNYFVGIGLFLSKKTNYYLIPAFLSAFLNIALNFKLIPLYGMYGAGLSLVIAQVVYTAILSYLSGKQIKMKYEWGKIVIIFVISIILFLTSVGLSFGNIFINLAFKLVLLCLLPYLLYVFKFFEQVEIDRLKASFYKLSTFSRKTK